MMYPVKFQNMTVSLAKCRFGTAILVPTYHSRFENKPFALAVDSDSVFGGENYFSPAHITSFDLNSSGELNLIVSSADSEKPYGIHPSNCIFIED